MSQLGVDLFLKLLDWLLFICNQLHDDLAAYSNLQQSTEKIPGLLTSVEYKFCHTRICLGTVSMQWKYWSINQSSPIHVPDDRCLIYWTKHTLWCIRRLPPPLKIGLVLIVTLVTWISERFLIFDWLEAVSILSEITMQDLKRFTKKYFDCHIHSWLAVILTPEPVA